MNTYNIYVIRWIYAVTLHSVTWTRIYLRMLISMFSADLHAFVSHILKRVHF